MDITLKGGPLDGEVVSITVSSTTYRTQIENRHVVYDQTNERTERGQQVFTHRAPVIQSKVNP
ncbi:hypothetical protein V5E97_08595 [Singulisphaera sp. Ch08]|uniref:Uncharacterized protein n=1 Tax=Singulisphaera sp. Ch08 TaxID=3120278 RepID=A0AAU7CM12_9BACT